MIIQIPELIGAKVISAERSGDRSNPPVTVKVTFDNHLILEMRDNHPSEPPSILLWKDSWS